MINFDNLNIFLFILPIYQMLFYAVQLFTLNKIKDSSHFPLGILMLLILIYLAISSTSYLGYLNLYDYLFIIQIPILLAILPTNYLYFSALTDYKPEISTRQTIVLYLPSVFTLILNFVSLINLSPNQTSMYLCPECSLADYGEEAINFTTILFLFSNVGFILFQIIITAIHYLRNMNKIINIKKSNPTYMPHLQLLWSHIILISIVSLVILISVMNLLTPIYNTLLSTILNLGIIISSGIAGYFSLKQNKLLLEVSSMENKDDKITKIVNNSDNIKRSDFVSEEDAKIIIANLKHHLVTDKPYLNKKLGANELAEKIGVSKQKLTYVVNVVMDTNFYGIINKYRILEAKEMLKKSETQNYKIDVISQDVGFQSKSSFNACFKKITGQTPSEYRRTNSKGGFK